MEWRTVNENKPVQDVLVFHVDHCLDELSEELFGLILSQIPFFFPSDEVQQVPVWRKLLDNGDELRCAMDLLQKSGGFIDKIYKRKFARLPQKL